MKYLLDTHAIIWYLTEDNKLSEKALVLIRRKKYLYVSIASLWEIGIKRSIGKLVFNYTSAELKRELDRLDIKLLPILPSHIDAVSSLPFIHKDPFDRMIVAQAATEGMTVITCDENIPLYDIETAW